MIRTVVMAALATSAIANSDASSAESFATERYLQTQYETVQVPRKPWCKKGFVDKTQGKALFWKCGIGCEGGYGSWTDACCQCACVAPTGPPAPCSQPLVEFPGVYTTFAPATAEPSSQPVSQVVASTRLSTPAATGSTSLAVADQSLFAPGDLVTISPGTPIEEARTLVGLGSVLLFKEPLKNTHPVNAVITRTARPVSPSNQKVDVTNELGSDGFLSKTSKASPGGGQASPASESESSRMPLSLVVLVICLSVGVLLAIFCIFMCFQGCPCFDADTMHSTKKKISRVQPISDSISTSANQPCGELASSGHKMFVPEMPNGKVDMKIVDGGSECDTTSTRTPTPRVSVITNCSNDSWRSQNAPRRPSIVSNESFGAVHCALRADLRESSKFGSYLSPAPPHTSSIRSQSSSPRPSLVRAGDEQINENRRARSSSPRPSLRSMADESLKSQQRGSRSVSPRPSVTSATSTGSSRT